MKRTLLTVNENHGAPPLKKAVGEIIRRISETLPDLREPVSMYLAGGIAVNFYTGYRSTTDIDASFSRLLLLPKQEELVVSYEAEEGARRTVYFDMKYNATFAVLHPDYEEDALIVEGKEFEAKNICLKILTPVDLVVSKIARFTGRDREDIKQLALHQSLDPLEVEERTTEALDYYIGNTTMLKLNLRDALDDIKQVQSRKPLQEIILDTKSKIPENLQLLSKVIEQYYQLIEVQQNPTIQKQISKPNVEQQRLVYRQKYQELQSRVRQYPSFSDSPTWEVDVGVALLVLKESFDPNEVGRVLAQSNQLQEWKASLPNDEYMMKGKEYIHQVYEQAQQLQEARSLQQQQPQKQDFDLHL